MHLDTLLYLNKHVEIQLEKAKKAVQTHSRIFYSRYLNNRIKVICYMLLVRPILTHGCLVWYNVGPTIMEKLRAFERKCLRACTGLYRSEETNYNAANIPRLDNFIIKLTRDYLIISSSIYPNDEYYIKKLSFQGIFRPKLFYKSTRPEG